MTESLHELFVRHASIVIDTDAYQTNPQLADLANRICELGGLAISDVTTAGMTVWYSHASIEVWEHTADGVKFSRDSRTVRRTVSVPFPPEWQPVEVSNMGDVGRAYV